MAPSKIDSPDMEFHPPSITKPSPLRIIKRSQTITSCSAPREIVGQRDRDLSESSSKSKGSPPIGPDRPLTIHKLRKRARGRVPSVLEGLDDGSLKLQADDTIQNLIKRHSGGQNSNEDDSELTPKARQEISRSMSAGVFLKSEFFRGSAEDDAGMGFPRSSLDPINSDTASTSINQDTNRSPNSPPKFPRRRLSKSKNFILKAIGSRNAIEPRPIGESALASSKGTLLRQLSRSDRNISSSIYAASIVPADSTDPFELEEQDITDICIDPRISDYGHSRTSSQSSSNSVSVTPKAFVLCPRVIFTPEINDVDSGICSIWVAIEVTGILRRADWHGYYPQNYEDMPPQNNSFQVQDTKAYGTLYGIRIDLIPGRDCVVEEVFGDLQEEKMLNANKTFLILAKVRLCKVKNSSSHVKESSDELIAELENHLGDTLTQYLTVRLKYQHTGFPNWKNGSLTSSGISSTVHHTKIQTEAIAVVKRTNLQSAWSPRPSRTMHLPLAANPVIPLIETHLPTEEAREAIRRLEDERLPIPLTSGIGGGVHGQKSSSEETVRTNVITSTIDSAVSMLINEAQDDRSLTPESMRALEAIDSAAEAEVDPARKIWTEMRRTSRPSYHKRRSITASNYFSAEEPCDMSRSNSTSVSESGKDYVNRVATAMDQAVDQERSRIRAIALRNKRSVGADTLRSMAPSKKDFTKGTSSAIGLGLGGGRSWGWGPPWW